MRRLLPACVACLLAASAVARASELQVTVGIGGTCRAGSWTPLVVSGGRPGDVLRAAVQDADGMEVWSPGLCVASGTVPTRFAVRFGRPEGHVRLENVTTGTSAEIDVPPPLPSTARVWLVIGDLPSAGRTARLMVRPDASRPVVTFLAADGATPPATVAVGCTGRDLDGVDVVVACGRALGAVAPEFLAAIDDWIRDGGHLVLAAGASAEGLTAAGGLPAGWLPGKVAELVPLRRPAVVETHARASGLAEQPDAENLRVPLLANRGSLAGAVDLFEGNAPTDLPLVVRRAHGFGSISWIGLDLDAAPFVGWRGTDMLLVRMLGGRGLGEEAGRTVAEAAGPPDLAGQLRVALETPGADGGIGTVPFAVIAALGLAYVACVFPLDWWIVSRSGRPWLAWLTLPALVAGFTAVVWGASGRWRTDEASGMRVVEVIDVDAQCGRLRGWSWLAAWRRENVAVDVAVVPGAGQGGDATVSWCADSGRGFGAIDAAAPHPTLAAAEYGYGDTLAVLERVPVAAHSSRLFEARWSGTVAAPVTSGLVRDGPGTLRGSFVLNLPFGLRDCRLAHAGLVYDLGDLAPGARCDLAAGPGPLSLVAVLTRRAQLTERQAGPRWDPGATDLAHILEMAGFHAAAGGPGFTGLESGRLARLDLSPLLNLDRAVLVGTAADPPPEWKTPWLVGDAGGEPAAAPPCAARVYRIVVPLAAPSRAAGAVAE